MKSRSKSPNSRRSILNQMTMVQLRDLAKKHNISVSSADTKIGIGSKLMSALTADQIRRAGNSKQRKVATSKKLSKKKSTKRRSASPCPKKKTITRKAYTRADGTKVRAVTYCLSK